MSKKHRHRHRYDYELEHRTRNIIPENQLIILIGLMLLFADNNPQYDVYDGMEQKSEEDNIKCYSFNDTPCGTETIHIQEYELENTETNNNIIIDDETDMEEDNLKLREAVVYEVTEDTESAGSDAGKSNIQIYNAILRDTESAENDAEGLNENTILEIPEKEHIIAVSKVTIYNTSIVQFYPNENDEYYYTSEPAVIKLPVILSEPNIQVFIEVLTKFPEPIFEINDFNKKVFLNQCRLILGTNKLFIKGFIKEDVEYATAQCIDANSISGSIKKVSLNIPFQGSAKVFFHTPPKISNQASRIDLEVLNPEKNGADLSEKSFGHFEFLNEKVFAELDSTEILETHIKEEIKILENTLDDAHTFQKMRSKIILDLKLNLLQKQEVFIADCDEEEDTGEDKREDNNS